MEGLKVLLVDDDEQFGAMLRVYLESMDVQVVGQARNGMQALAYAELLEPDLVLLDIRMPGMSGTDVARYLRTTDPSMQIVFLSGLDVEQHRDVVAVPGIDGFIPKAGFTEILPDVIRDAGTTRAHGLSAAEAGHNFAWKGAPSGVPERQRL